MGTKTEIEWTDATWWPMKKMKQLLLSLALCATMNAQQITPMQPAHSADWNVTSSHTLTVFTKEMCAQNPKFEVILKFPDHQEVVFNCAATAPDPLPTALAAVRAVNPAN